MRYNNHLNYRERQQFLLKVRIVFSIVVVAILGSIIIGYINVSSQEVNNSVDQTTTNQSSGYFAATTKIFKSPYFQFQTNDSWSEVPAESTANKFVYRSLRTKLIQHQLVIYVDTIPEDLGVLHVLPVNPKGVGELLPQNVSAPCPTVVKNINQEYENVVIGEIPFLCRIDDPDYTVLAGFPNDGVVLNLERPEGQKSKYVIKYTNVTANPNSAQFQEIVASFQTR